MSAILSKRSVILLSILLVFSKSFTAACTNYWSMSGRTNWTLNTLDAESAALRINFKEDVDIKNLKYAINSNYDTLVEASSTFDATASEVEQEHIIAASQRDFIWVGKNTILCTNVKNIDNSFLARIKSPYFNANYDKMGNFSQYRLAKINAEQFTAIPLKDYLTSLQSNNSFSYSTSYGFKDIYTLDDVYLAGKSGDVGAIGGINISSKIGGEIASVQDNDSEQSQLVDYDFDIIYQAFEEDFDHDAEFVSQDLEVFCHMQSNSYQGYAGFDFFRNVNANEIDCLSGMQFSTESAWN